MKLNAKMWLFSTAAVFVLLSLAEFLTNRLVLQPWHGELFPGLVAADPMTARIWSYLGRLIFSAFFVLIYTRGYEGKPGLGEGIRYAVLVGVLIHVPAFFANLVTANIPLDFLVVRMLLGIAWLVASGMILGLLYRASPTMA